MRLHHDPKIVFLSFFLDRETEIQELMMCADLELICLPLWCTFVVQLYFLQNRILILFLYMKVSCCCIKLCDI